MPVEGGGDAECSGGPGFLEFFVYLVVEAFELVLLLLDFFGFHFGDEFVEYYCEAFEPCVAVVVEFCFVGLPEPVVDSVEPAYGEVELALFSVLLFCHGFCFRYAGFVPHYLLIRLFCGIYFGTYIFILICCVILLFFGKERLFYCRV